MRARLTSLLALLLAVAFVSVGITYAAEKDYDEAQAAMEQATQEQAGQKVEVKGMVEEKEGKTTLEMKEIKPEGVASEAVAATEKPE